MSPRPHGVIDTETSDLLHLVADTESPVGRDAVELFLDACRIDAKHHGGVVSPSRVRALMAGADVEHHRYSSLWAAFTGKGKPMRRLPGQFEECTGSTTGNNGRLYPLRKWVGEQP